MILGRQKTMNACINQEQEALDKLKYQGRTFRNKNMYNIQKFFFNQKTKNKVYKVKIKAVSLKTKAKIN